MSKSKIINKLLDENTSNKMESKLNKIEKLLSDINSKIELEKEKTDVDWENIRSTTYGDTVKIDALFQSIMGDEKYQEYIKFYRRVSAGWMKRLITNENIKKQI